MFIFFEMPSASMPTDVSDWFGFENRHVAPFLDRHCLQP